MWSIERFVTYTIFCQSRPSDVSEGRWRAMLAQGPSAEAFLQSDSDAHEARKEERRRDKKRWSW